MTPAIGGASGDSGKSNKSSKNSKNKKENINCNNNTVEINETKHESSRDFCLFVMQRSRTIALEEETYYRFMPSNRFVIHFWLFFQSITQTNYHLQCKTRVRFQHGMLCCFFLLLVLAQ